MVPDRLEHIPEHLRVAETFGHQGWIWGACFLLVAVLFLLPEKGTPAPIVLELSGGSAALGLALLGYEVWRRSHRTHLARQGEGLAVYRRGRFTLLLSPQEVTRRKAGLSIMIRIGGGLGLAGLAFTAVGILELHRAGPSPDILMVLALGLSCLASLASAAWTRFFCINLEIPRRKGSLGVETVLVRPLHLAALIP